MKVENASDRSDDSGSDSSSCSSSDVESSSTGSNISSESSSNGSNISSISEDDCFVGTDWLMGDFFQEESMDVDVMGNIGADHFFDVGGDVISEIWKDLFQEEEQHFDGYSVQWLRLQRMPRGDEQK
jgi:hypothetical protein